MKSENGTPPGYPVQEDYSLPSETDLSLYSPRPNAPLLFLAESTPVKTPSQCWQSEYPSYVSLALR